MYDFEVRYNTGETRRIVAKDTVDAQNQAECGAPPMAVQWKLFGMPYIGCGEIQLTPIHNRG